MPKAITIRTDDTTLDRLEAMARSSERSRNYLANLALQEFVARHDEAALCAPIAVPVAERLADYRSELWSDDDIKAFLAYLDDERQRDVAVDRVGEL